MYICDTTMFPTAFGISCRTSIINSMDSNGFPRPVEVWLILMGCCLWRGKRELVACNPKLRGQSGGIMYINIYIYIYIYT